MRRQKNSYGVNKLGTKYEPKAEDLILRSVGAYLKVPTEIKKEFGFSEQSESPELEFERTGNTLSLTYTFKLENAKIMKKSEE